MRNRHKCDAGGLLDYFGRQMIRKQEIMRVWGTDTRQVFARESLKCEATDTLSTLERFYCWLCGCMMVWDDSLPIFWRNCPSGHLQKFLITYIGTMVEL